MAATQGLTLPGAPASGEQQGVGGGERATSRVTAAVLVSLMVVGLLVRVVVAHQPIFADELSTFWISAKHSLGGVLSLLYSTGRIQHAEITPPLSFLTSWLTTRVGDSPELLRVPALIAGTATIPAVYLLGLRSVGRRAGLIAAALVTFSPFMIYYSAEARAYGLLMLLVVGAVLSMLLALRSGRRRYWVLYAVCSAAAFYSHYTCLFVLAVAFVWLLWAHPDHRRAALLANLGAVLLVVPWIPGLIADLQSPTIKILSELSPFTASAVRIDVEHWALGYPYSVAGGLRSLPGLPSLVLLAIAAGVSGWMVLVRRRVPVPADAPAPGGRNLLLMLVLALATPVGEILGSATGSHIIGTRDLAASWPFLALFAAAVVSAAGRRVGAVAGALAVVAFILGAAKMFDTNFQRPDYQAAANYVASTATPKDVVVDETGKLSPGPLTGFDVAFHGHARVIRAAAPAERDHPYTVFDPIVSIPAAERQAARLANGARIFLITARLPEQSPHTNVPAELPGGYTLATLRTYPALEDTLVAVYSR